MAVNSLKEQNNRIFENATLITNATIIISNLHVINTIAGILLALFIIIGNSLVLAAVVKYERLRTTTNILIANLALVDVLVGVLTVPSISFLQEPVFENKYVCITTLSVQGAVKVVNTLSIVVIAIERYIRIVFPLRAIKIITIRKCSVVISLVWSYGLVCFVVMYVHSYMDSRKPSTCPEPYEIMLYLAMAHVIFGIITTTSICIRVSLIAKKIQTTIIAQMIATNYQTAVEYKRQRKLTKRLAGIIFLYFICLLPTILASLVIYSTTIVVEHKLDVVAALRLVISVSSAVNVWLYPGCDREFRNTIWNMLNLRSNQVHDLTL